MKNFTKTIILAFLISIIIHILLYISIDRTIKIDKLKINTSDKIRKTDKLGFTSIKYVKVKKPQVKETIVKPVSKKTSKSRLSKKSIKRQNKIKKVVKTIKLPTNKKAVDLKKLFTRKVKEAEAYDTLDSYGSPSLQNQKERYAVQQLDSLTQSYIKLYGEQYYKFSKEQKKYIKQNIKDIGLITERYLRYPSISIRTRQSGMNIVEFNLHPNGDISDLRLVDGSGYTALDRNSVETIEIAYKDYPKPKETIPIKIYVKYIMN